MRIRRCGGVRQDGRNVFDAILKYLDLGYNL